MMRSFGGKGWGAALAMLGLALPAAAQDTVKVGTETKRTSGTVLALTAGDVACYIRLKDDRGVPFEEMADFDLCQQRALLGKRVALTYALNKVQAPECQGDPACKKTRTVALVTAAKVAAATPPPATAAAPPPPAPAAPARTTWCTADELTVFNCATNTRIVSACASKGATATSGSLQYRFGKPDGNQPEIAQPPGKVVPSQAATGGTLVFSGGGGAWLRFGVEQLQSTLYTAIGKFGPKGEVQDRSGLVVHEKGKEIASFKCVRKPTSELGPDWFGRAGIKDGGQDFDLPE